MEYLSIDLKQQKRGAMVRVHLMGNAANVQLMDSSGFSSYKSGRQYGYWGNPLHPLAR